MYKWLHEQWRQTSDQESFPEGQRTDYRHVPMELTGDLKRLQESNERLIDDIGQRMERAKQFASTSTPRDPDQIPQPSFKGGAVAPPTPIKSEKVAERQPDVKPKTFSAPVWNKELDNLYYYAQTPQKQWPDSPRPRRLSREGFEYGRHVVRDPRRHGGAVDSVQDSLSVLEIKPDSQFKEYHMRTNAPHLTRPSQPDGGYSSENESNTSSPTMRDVRHYNSPASPDYSDASIRPQTSMNQFKCYKPVIYEDVLNTTPPRRDRNRAPEVVPIFTSPRGRQRVKRASPTIIRNSRRLSPSPKRRSLVQPVQPIINTVGINCTTQTSPSTSNQNQTVFKVPAIPPWRSQPSAASPTRNQNSVTAQAPSQRTMPLTNTSTMNHTTQSCPSTPLKRKPKKLTFNGTNWKEFRMEFEVCAANHGWDDAEKYRELTNALTGKAVMVLRQKVLSSWTYDTLIKALEQRHGLPDSMVALYDKLYDYRQTSAQKLHEFVDEISVLSEKITEAPEQQDRHALTCLLRGLYNEEQKLYVREKEPKTFHEGVKLAERFENLHAESFKKRPTIK